MLNLNNKINGGMDMNSAKSYLVMCSINVFTNFGFCFLQRSKSLWFRS